MLRFVCLVFVCCLQALYVSAQASDTFAVYFRLDDPFLNAAAEKDLSKTIVKIDASSTVTVVGYADHLGDTYYNDMLAFRRAQNVAAFLQNSGVDRNLIKTVIGRGEVRRKVEKAEGYWEDRRVDIVAKSKLSPVKPAPVPEPVVPPPPVLVSNEVDDSVEVVTKESIEKAEVGSTLKIDKLYFVGGRDIFKPGADDVLNELYEILKEDTSLRIQIEGHVCCTDGEDGIDLGTGIKNLSFARAKAVYNYLVSRGINRDRLAAVGLAGAYKVEMDESEQQMADRNRRVEIRILAK